MALVKLPRGLLWPYDYHQLNGQFNPPTGLTSVTFNSTNDRAEFTGRVAIVGQGTKTLSGAGGGSIKIGIISSITWADGASTMSIGVQDLATGSGPPPVGDTTFDVHRAAVGGDGTFTTPWTTAVMTTGSKSIAHGDLVTVVMHFTNRAGADVFTLSFPDTANGGRPSVHFSDSGGALGTQFGIPCVVFVFDDGTLGMLDGGLLQTAAAVASTAYANASNPDEYGMMFRVPVATEIDAAWGRISAANAACDIRMSIYQDPTGTPVELFGRDMLGEQLTSTNHNIVETFPPVALVAGVNYGLTWKHNGTSNISFIQHTLGDAAFRGLYSGGATIAQLTRNNASGAFTAASTVIMMHMGVRLSALDDGEGSGGGMVHILGGSVVR